MHTWWTFSRSLPLLTFLFARFASPSVTAFPVAGCIQGDCRDGYGTFVHANGDRYVGDFRDGQPHGKGILYARSGNKYLGDWDMSRREGTGRMIFREGHVYTGAFSRDQFHGQGRMDFANGDRYEGQWKQNRPHGKGIYTYRNHAWYEGSFENGCFQGEGIFHHRDGSRIQGIWDRGRIQDAWPEGLAPETVRWEDSAPAVTDLAGPGENRTAAGQESGGRQPTLRVWALVIGISQYRQMPTLRYADDDAYRFYAFLKSPEGGALPAGQLRLLVDEQATQENIRHSLQALAAAAGPRDVLLVYYSGHGLEGAFVPADFDGVSQLLPHVELREWLGRSEARCKVLISDACHAGSLVAPPTGQDLAARGSGMDGISRYYDALTASGAGTALLLSSRSREISLEDGSLRAGVFSHFLVRGLSGEADADRDQLVSLQEIFNFVEAGVRRYTAGAQRPMLAGDFDPALPLSVVLRPSADRP